MSPTHPRSAMLPARGRGLLAFLAVAAASSALAPAARADDVRRRVAFRSAPSAAADRSGGSMPPLQRDAKPRRWTRSFGLDLSAATWVPLSVGPELVVELPGRLLLQAHLGWLPDLYSHGLSDSLEEAGVYDADVGHLVDGALRGATTWRLAAGWRPFDGAGLELTLGYARVAVDGGTSSGEIIPLVPSDVADQIAEELGDLDLDIGIDLDSTIHHFTVAAGWRWLIGEHLVIRANLGYLQAFASSSRLKIEGFPELSALAEPTVEAVLHEQYMRYIKVPVVGLGIGYRFF